MIVDRMAPYVLKKNNFTNIKIVNMNLHLHVHVNINFWSGCKKG